jgi:hypothetical protein
MTAMQNTRPSLIAPPTAARSLSYLQHKTLPSHTVSTNQALATAGDRAIASGNVAPVHQHQQMKA